MLCCKPATSTVGLGGGGLVLPVAGEPSWISVNGHPFADKTSRMISKVFSMLPTIETLPHCSPLLCFTLMSAPLRLQMKFIVSPRTPSMQRIWTACILITVWRIIPYAGSTGASRNHSGRAVLCGSPWTSHLVLRLSPADWGCTPGGAATRLWGGMATAFWGAPTLGGDKTLSRGGFFSFRSRLRLLWDFFRRPRLLLLPLLRLRLRLFLGERLCFLFLLALRFRRLLLLLRRSLCFRLLLWLRLRLRLRQGQRRRARRNSHVRRRRRGVTRRCKRTWKTRIAPPWRNSRAERNVLEPNHHALPW
mmetsp:Transcript_72524/g.201099  ORF Transcript_72524/g.201099 Transcript_72524/m.201099 type:complete len:305 (-) Transcript_72524:122-1036(-)